jgi:glycosyltransferase involved in cell wall biosynthesis
VRIVYLHQYFVTPSQPGGTRSYEMARWLVARGHQVDMVTTDAGAASDAPSWRVSDEDGIRVHWANVPYSNQLGWFGRVRAFLTFALRSSRRAAALDADVIFATSTPLTIAIPAIWAAWRRRIPYVFEVRDIWPAVPIALGALRNPVLSWLARRLEHVAYHRAARVVALAPGMGEEVQRTGYPASKITIIPNGCDLDVFDAEAAVISPLPQDLLEWVGDAPLILFAGTLGRANKVGYVAEIASAMRTRDPGIRFIIAGNGQERDAIAALAKRLGVLDVNLKLLPAMPKRELATFVARSDLCLSLFSGPPVLWKDAVQNKFFDALAAGKPVATNHFGWQCQIATEYDVGFEIAGNDPAASADRIAVAVRDKAWLFGVKDRALQLARGRFARTKLADELEQVLVAVASQA